MKRSFILISFVFLAFVFTAQAQKKRILPTKKPSTVEKTPNVAIVIDERLAVLRIQPSLYADSVQRMRTGRILADRKSVV